VISFPLNSMSTDSPSFEEFCTLTELFAGDGELLVVQLVHEDVAGAVPVKELKLFRSMRIVSIDSPALNRFSMTLPLLRFFSFVRTMPASSRVDMLKFDDRPELVVVFDDRPGRKSDVEGITAAG